jgi:hypothetical protein
MFDAERGKGEWFQMSSRLMDFISKQKAASDFFVERQDCRYLPIAFMPRASASC